MVDPEVIRLQPLTAIHMILAKYAKKGKAVDIHFLAQQMGRSACEINKFLQILEEMGFVCREGRMIGLTEAGMN